MSYFTEITPTKTKKSIGNKKWKFMLYHESPSEREDGMDYCAFLFRNDDRTFFGIKEFFDDAIPHMNKFREIATKIVIDASFRKLHLSDNSELPRLWKRH